QNWKKRSPWTKILCIDDAENVFLGFHDEIRRCEESCYDQRLHGEIDGMERRSRLTCDRPIPGCYNVTANTAASLLTNGRRSSGHLERHWVRCCARDSFVPGES